MLQLNLYKEGKEIELSVYDYLNEENIIYSGFFDNSELVLDTARFTINVNLKFGMIENYTYFKNIHNGKREDNDRMMMSDYSEILYGDIKKFIMDKTDDWLEEYCKNNPTEDNFTNIFSRFIYSDDDIEITDISQIQLKRKAFYNSLGMDKIPFCLDFGFRINSNEV